MSVFSRAEELYGTSSVARDASTSFSPSLSLISLSSFRHIAWITGRHVYLFFLKKRNNIQSWHRARRHVREPLPSRAFQPERCVVIFLPLQIGDVNTRPLKCNENMELPYNPVTGALTNSQSITSCDVNSLRKFTSRDLPYIF